MAEETPQPQIKEKPHDDENPQNAGIEEAGDGLDEELPMPHGLEVLAALEAVLFAANQPLNNKKISNLLNGVPEEEIEEAVETLIRRYEDPGCGLQLMEVGGGWQLATRPEVSDWVLRLHKHRKRNPLTPSLMESLAIIAYKQPITRAEVESIRGVDCGTALRSLQDASLIEVIGRKDTLGKPPLYGTTELFLKTFGLKALGELPPLSGDKTPTLTPPRDDDSEEPGAEEAQAPTEEPAGEAAAPHAEEPAEASEGESSPVDHPDQSEEEPDDKQ